MALMVTHRALQLCSNQNEFNLISHLDRKSLWNGFRWVFLVGRICRFCCNIAYYDVRYRDLLSKKVVLACQRHFLLLNWFALCYVVILFCIKWLCGIFSVLFSNGYLVVSYKLIELGLAVDQNIAKANISARIRRFLVINIDLYVFLFGW